MACDCKDIELGSYGNQVELHVPNNITIHKNDPERTLAKTICVDRCLEYEIKDLWSRSITTTGCCCGHNKVQGYIGVVDEYIPRMKKLGYIVRYNECRPGDEDCFIPKSNQ